MGSVAVSGTGDFWDSKGLHGGNATTFLMGAFVGSPRNEAGKLTRAKLGGSTNGLTGRRSAIVQIWSCRTTNTQEGENCHVKEEGREDAAAANSTKLMFSLSGMEDAMRRKQTVCRWIWGCVQGGQS